MRKFNEWMSFRQTVEETSDSYGFIGTYNSENLSNLEENSERIEVESAMSLIPQSYRGQFQTCEAVSAGKSRNENNAEIVWITNNDQGITYIFEKKEGEEKKFILKDLTGRGIASTVTASKLKTLDYDFEDGWIDSCKKGDSVKIDDVKVTCIG